jgi:hypothetical protein
VSAAQGSEVGWSCCRIKERHGIMHVLNPSALEQNSKGCQNAPMHLEDLEYTKIISNFPIDLNAAKQMLSEHANPKLGVHRPPKSPEKAHPPPHLVSENFFCHDLSEGDTLQGLALRYNVLVQKNKKNLVFFFSFFFLAKEVKKKQANNEKNQTHSISFRSLTSRKQTDSLETKSFICVNSTSQSTSTRKYQLQWTRIH